MAVLGAGLFPVLGAGRILEIPTKDAWAAGRPLAWALIVTGIISVTAGAVNARRLGRSSRTTTLAEACVQLAAYIDEECPSIALRAVGIHVWRVDGPFFARRLYREQQFLLRQRQSSHVSFTKGKGLIGRVWERRVPEARNFESDFASVGTPGDFDNVPADQRLGLSWEEFQRTRRYRSVWAAPLFKGSDYEGSVVGVISVDIQATGAFEELKKATEQTEGASELAAILSACETTLSRH